MHFSGIKLTVGVSLSWLHVSKFHCFWALLNECGSVTQQYVSLDINIKQL